MRIAPACHSPALPLRCVTPEQVAVRVCPGTAQYVGAAYAAQITPEVIPGVAEQDMGPATDAPCEVGVSGKWPWQLPPEAAQTPPPPELVYVPYPVPVSTRMGNLLDLLA